MGSPRLFELFHKITLQIRSNLQPFGGIQCILVGDWLQLKPVADKFDDGPNLYHLFPHTIQLTIMHRQNEREVVYRNIQLFHEHARGCAQCFRHGFATWRLWIFHCYWHRKSSRSWLPSSFCVIFQAWSPHHCTNIHNGTWFFCKKTQWCCCCYQSRWGWTCYP